MLKRVVNIVTLACPSTTCGRLQSHNMDLVVPVKRSKLRVPELLRNAFSVSKTHLAILSLATSSSTSSYFCSSFLILFLKSELRTTCFANFIIKAMFPSFICLPQVVTAYTDSLDLLKIISSHSSQTCFTISEAYLISSYLPAPMLLLVACYFTRWNL